jgi:thioredoxin reductase (NADPH)
MKAQEKLFSNPKISVIFNSEPRAFAKNGEKMATEIENVTTRKRQTLIADGVFVFIGMQPNVSLFSDQMESDHWSYIKTDEDMRTSLPDIFAVGDVTSKKYRQITTAVADGTIAAMAIAKELN